MSDDSKTEEEKITALRNAIEVGLASELVECSYEEFTEWVRSGGRDEMLLASERPTSGSTSKPSR